MLTNEKEMQMKTSILTAAIAFACAGAFAQSVLVSNANPIYLNNNGVQTLLGPSTGTTFEAELVLVGVSVGVRP